MIRVLIADDHSLMRAGLKMILSETEDLRVAEEASNGEEVLDKLKNNSFDVMLLDINMPKKSGFEVLAELRAMGNRMPVVVLSTFSAEDYGDSAIKAGAAGYLTKEQAPEKLIDAIRKVVK
jgi:two-component system, NarL family, invasion response regulator UvrY